MTNIDRYNNIFNNVFGININELNIDFNVKNIKKWDSMTHISLVSAIEDTFDIMFDADDIIDFNSYTKGVEILRKYNISI